MIGDVEKRVVLAALLCIVFLSWYSRAVVKVPPPAPPQEGHSPVAVLRRPEVNKALYPLEEEEIVSIESTTLRLEIGTSSGAIRQAILKGFLNDKKTGPLQAGGRFPLLRLQSVDAGLRFHVLEAANNRVVLYASHNSGSSYQLVYEIDDRDPLVLLTVGSTSSADDETTPVVITTSWDLGPDRANSYNQLEATVLATDKNNKTRHHRYQAQKSDKTVPRGTMVTLANQYFCESVIPERELAETRILAAPNGLIAAASHLGTIEGSYRVKVYLGPRDYFYLKNSGVAQALPVGVLGKIGLILLFVLKSLAQFTKSYGVALILFSAGITVLLSPMTIISYRSMRKMQELQPHMERIMAANKQDQLKANREIMALYREHRVSPLSGCLPMVLQMPIFIALFQAMSHFIGFRGQQFLWIADLSRPDRMVQLPISLPILGNAFNLLPIIMAGAMYLQTRLSQPKVGAASANPTAKMLSGPMMPVLFCVMFYSMPSGLVLYWLTNTLMSIALYRVAMQAPAMAK